MSRERDLGPVTIGLKLKTDVGGMRLVAGIGTIRKLHRALGELIADYEQENAAGVVVPGTHVPVEEVFGPFQVKG